MHVSARSDSDRRLPYFGSILCLRDAQAYWEAPC